MATPQEILNTFASVLHRRLFKGKGYRKNGKTWISNCPWPRIVNLQLSSCNTSLEASFTFNLGLSIPQVRSTLNRPALKNESLREHDCEIRIRLSRLLGKSDTFWTVTSADDPEALADQWQTILENHALPWFDRFPDFIAIAECENLPPARHILLRALAFHLAGLPDKAKKEISRILAEQHSDPSALIRIASDCGLQIPDGFACACEEYEQSQAT